MLMPCMRCRLLSRSRMSNREKAEIARGAPKCFYSVLDRIEVGGGL
jgi:hypothetical protein